MARLPYPEPASLPEENRRLLEQLPPLNIFRMLAGAGASFAPFMTMVDAYLNAGALDPEVRELVILRVGHLCHAPYEIHQHERVSRTLGISDARIRACGDVLPNPLFSDAENAALQFADDQVRNVKASRTCFEAARAHLTDTQMQELILIVGIYMMVSRYLETMEIELEDAPIAGSGLEDIRQATRHHG